MLEYRRWLGEAHEWSPQLFAITALQYATLMALPLTFLELGSEFAALPVFGGAALEVMRSMLRRQLKRRVRWRFMTEIARRALDKRTLVPEADVESAFWAAYLLERAITVDVPAVIAAGLAGASVLVLAAPALGSSLIGSLVGLLVLSVGLTIWSNRFRQRASNAVVEHRQRAAGWVAAAERDSGEIYGARAREPFLAQLTRDMGKWTSAESRLEQKRLQQRLLLGALFLTGIWVILRSQHVDPFHLRPDHSLSARSVAGLLLLSTGIPICYVFAEHADSMLTAFASLRQLLPKKAASSPNPVRALVMRPMRLTAHALTYAYPSAARGPVLRELSFEIELDRLTLIVAPNGAGKTTLARLICGMLTPDRGTLQVDGIGCAEIARDDFGFVPQNPLIIDTLTIEENVRLVAPDADAEAIGRLLFELGLERSIGSLAGELSRGEQRRIAIARAILKEPRLLLLDEPDVWLDKTGREILARVLQRQLPARAVIVVSHRADWLPTDARVIDLER